MSFSEQLLAAGEDIWAALEDHAFVVERTARALDPDAFSHWIEQDDRELFDDARVSAIAGTGAETIDTMTHLMQLAHAILDNLSELQRKVAAERELTPAELEGGRKVPTGVDDRNYHVRTASEASIVEISAATNPSGQGSLKISEHMTAVATDEPRYDRFIEKYTSDTFRTVVGWMRQLVDRSVEQYPGEQRAREGGVLTSARLEHAFWDVGYPGEGWGV